MLLRLSRLTIITIGFACAISSLAYAQKLNLGGPKNCRLLKEVSTNKTEIRKVIETPVIFANNSNTDFSVPNGMRFRSYRALMLAENNASYKVAIYLKYNNNTNDKPFDQKILFKKDEQKSLSFRSGTNRQPYQINLRVGGENNNAYSVAVMACL